MPFLDATSSEIERQGYIKYLSEELGVSEEQIIGDYARQKNREPEKNETRPVSKSRNLLNISRDLNAMLLLMNNRSEFETFRKAVRINLLNDREAQSLYAVLENASREEVSDTDLILQMIEDQDLKNLVVQSFDSSLYRVSNPDEAVKEAINSVLLEELLEKRRRIQGMVNSASVEGISDSQLIELMETLRDLDNEIIALQNS
jgi:DNA primase